MWRTLFLSLAACSVIGAGIPVQWIPTPVASAITSNPYVTNSATSSANISAPTTSLPFTNNGNMVVLMFSGSTVSGIITNVTYGGQTCTTNAQFVSSGDSDSSQCIYYLNNAPSGSNSFVVGRTSGAPLSAGWIMLSIASAATTQDGERATNAPGGNSLGRTNTVSTSAGNLVLYFGASASFNAGLSFAGGMTELQELSNGSCDAAAGSTNAVGSSTTVSYSYGNNAHNSAFAWVVK